jgi:hypothetical protein
MSETPATCPYCNEEMQPGAVIGDRYALKWQPDDKAKILGIWSTGHKIGTKGLLSRPNVTGFRCSSCEKIIVDG